MVVPINRTAEFIRFVHETEAKTGMQMVAFGTPATEMCTCA